MKLILVVILAIVLGLLGLYIAFNWKKLRRKAKTTLTMLLLLLGAVETTVILVPIEPSMNYIERARVVVDSGSAVDGAHDVVICDIDDDGKPDLVVDAYRADKGYWYKQPNDPTDGSAWTRYTIDSSIADVHDSQVDDIDGDGDNDVVSVGRASDIIKWYRCPSDPTDSWDAKTIDSGDSHIPNPRSVAIGDIDGQYGLDIAVAANDYKELNKNCIIFYLAPSDPYTGEWSRYVLENSNIHQGSTIAISDIDKDGNPDIIAGIANGTSSSSLTSRLIIYFAPNDPTNTSAWVKKELGSKQALCEYGAYDINGDGYVDIIAKNETDTTNLNWNYVWWENPATDIRNMSKWAVHVVSDYYYRARNNCHQADFDGDGDIDLCFNCEGSSDSQNGKFLWCENSGDPTGEWIDHIIDQNNVYTQWAHDCYAKDIDGDGRPDFAGVACAGDYVLWYRNVGAEWTSFDDTTSPQ